ncbi:GNAT family N-acetyltransferase [Hyphobacterium sp.]|uniref:GNAT family N-acetyltransferase n=1 Tax=Hyphobacterium sp. TaxID=2004662 RepID=UPI003BA8F03A
MTRFAIAPRIETERLVLREITAADFEPVHRIWSDPENVRFIGGEPGTPMQSWRRITNSAGQWPILNYGYWSLDEKASGEFVGLVGFADFRRDSPKGFSTDPEIGYALDKRFHGQGYGTEAMRACVDWMDEYHPGKRTICMIEPANIPSLKIAERLGYEVYEKADFEGVEILLLERV